MTTTFKATLGPFRSKLSEDTFANKYKHTGCESWPELCRVLVEEVCRDKMTPEDKTQLIQYMAEMKFIPGGRYLYYAGRPVKYYNNCGSYDTRVLTSQGWVKMGEVVGQTLNVLSPVDGFFYPAKFHSHGEQSINEITFVPIRGKSKIEYTVKFTSGHKWPLIDGSYTENLSVGDVVPSNEWSLDTNDLAFAHGFVYGDGNRNGQLRLCGKKIKYLDRLSKTCKTVSYPPSSNGESNLYWNNTIEWKKRPTALETDPTYIASFIEGWLAADSCNDRLLSSVSKDAILWFADNAAMCGIVLSGELRSEVRDVQIGEYTYENHEIFIQNYSRGKDWQGFKVKRIIPLGVQPVFCPYEPIHNRIVIDHGIDTYQCFLLKAEADTREDWADVSWKAESCLLTGGGIGVDYSVYRPSGSIIKRTGGRASGPIPKMFMINEIGRNVIQGGSRRSAIYASLNHKHGDIEDFLKAKDWHSTEVRGTEGKTIWDLKAADFNYSAPLDMTNISVNYDTSWLAKYFISNDPGEVFRTNVAQALRTGEPGFSFNFFNQEKETLRNACCEVTSSDDSDVCNLGSVNMSRINSIVEFGDVITLGTQFLLCGTLVADLPYPKVGEVREKNRRLGLGLMGVHEWLLQRKYPYGSNPEFYRWLEVYRGVSNSVSEDFSRKLSISTPCANRAIAPTGTIGILAGTTTGIEPIYAVAYKRRYLSAGTKWKYQYAVDHMAQQMIDLYATDPEKIETASDLASDYERRIKFQAEVQDYVDMGISSTINLPQWDNSKDNTAYVKKFADVLASYAPRLRGFTCYPDGSRGGQPITRVDYSEATSRLGEEYEEEYNDICIIGGKSGYCGS